MRLTKPACKPTSHSAGSKWPPSAAPSFLRLLSASEALVIQVAGPSLLYLVGWAPSSRLSASAGGTANQIAARRVCQVISVERLVVCSLRASVEQRPARIARSRTAVQASAVEVFQLADEGALIGGTAAVLFACTLIVSSAKSLLFTTQGAGCKAVRSLLHQCSTTASTYETAIVIVSVVVM